MSPARASAGELNALANGAREDWSSHRPGSAVSLLDGPAGGLGDMRAGIAEPLRRILEDYLEVDSATNPKLQSLLRSDVMVRYFERITFPDLEILFDTDQRADKVQSSRLRTAYTSTIDRCVLFALAAAGVLH